MKFLYNKSLKNKLIIACVIVALFTFITPNYTRAAGGPLKNSIESFVIFVCDVLVKITQRAFTGEWEDIIVKNAGSSDAGGNNFNDWSTTDSNVDWPIIKISPELIFANKIPILNVNFIQDTQAAVDRGEDAGLYGDDTADSLENLRKVIATWYRTMRTIAVVGLLSVLVYIGIRIMISSVGEQRAKYKERLQDWLIAFILIFMLEYIMSFTLAITETVSDGLFEGAILPEIPFMEEYGEFKVNPPDIFSESADKNIEFSEAKNKFDNYTIDETDEAINDVWICKNCWHTHTDPRSTCEKCNGNDFEKISKKWYTLVIDLITTYNKAYGFGVAQEDEKQSAMEELITSNYRNISWTSRGEGNPEVSVDLTYDNERNKITDIHISENGDEVYARTTTEAVDGNITNYLNYARLYTQLKDEYLSFGFTVMYLSLTGFTIMFAFRYTKRVIYVAFLTLIAPLVALSYPLDKLKDGKSQAFDLWLKEYVFNVIIQPFHLLIYVVLTKAAANMIQTNFIFALVAMGFLIPAEKLVRRFFNLDQASTMSAAGSFAGGAIFSSIIGKLSRPPQPKEREKGKEDEDGGIYNTQRVPDRIGGFGSATPGIEGGAEGVAEAGGGAVANAVGGGISTAARTLSTNNLNNEEEDDGFGGLTAQWDAPEFNGQPNPSYRPPDETGENGMPAGVNNVVDTTRLFGNPVENNNNPPHNPEFSWKRAGKRIAGRVGRYLTSGETWKGVGRRIARGAGRVGGAAFLTAATSTISTTAGILSGDASTTAKLMAAAGAGGFAVGGKWADATINGGEALGNTILREGYGDDYKEFKRRQAVDKKINSYENRRQLEQTLKAETVARLYDNGGALLRKYYDAGITNADDIRRAEEQMAPIENRANTELADDDTRISYALAAKKYGAGLASSNPKTRQDNVQAIKNRMKNAAAERAKQNLGRELNEAERRAVDAYADAESNKTIRFVDSFNK